MSHPKPESRLADRWPLADAKARFDDIVQRAREAGPQRVTVKGHDAVVVLDIEQYERLLAQPATRPSPDGRSLIAIMAASSHLGEILLERHDEHSPVRDVVL